IVTRRRGHSIELTPSHRRLAVATLAETPRNAGLLERAIRRAQSYRIRRRGDQRGQRRQLVAGDDRNVLSVDDLRRGAQYVDRARRERADGRRQAHARRGADPDGEVADVVGRELVGLELYGSLEPATLGRLRVNDHLFVRRGGAARERATVQR